MVRLGVTCILISIFDSLISNFNRIPNVLIVLYFYGLIWVGLAL